jgi:hypothetical protein
MTIDAKSRLSITGPVLSTDLITYIANSRSDLWDGSILNAVIGTESNGVGANVWTGSTGTGNGGSHCNNWSSNVAVGSGGYAGAEGDSNTVNTTWLANTNLDCNDSRALYCVSQAADTALDDFSASTGSSGSGRIELFIDPPANVLKYDQITIYRIAGGTAPSNNCAVGTAVLTISPVTTTNTSFVDTGAVPGNTMYSYRACAFDSFGNILSSITADGVMSSN